MNRTKSAKRASPAKATKPAAKPKPAKRKAFDLDTFCLENQLQLSERYRRFITAAEARAYEGRFVAGLPGWSLESKLGVKFVEPSAQSLEDLGVDRARWPSLVSLASFPREADLLAVDAAHPDGPVSYVSHETGTPEPFAATLDVFLSGLLKKGDKSPLERAEDAAKRGRAAIEAKKYDDAVALLSPVASGPVATNLRGPLLPSGSEVFATVFHLLGCALEELGRDKEAEAALRRAMELESNGALLTLMSFCLERGRFDEVIALRKVVIVVSGDEAIYWRERYAAEAYLRKGDRLSAEAELRTLHGKFVVEDETKIDEVQSRLQSLAADPSLAEAAKELLTWFKPLRASAFSAEELTDLRIWWDGLPSHGAFWQPLLGEAVKLGKGKTPTDDQLLRIVAQTDVTVEQPKGDIDLAPLARLSRLDDVRIKGDVRSLEPLRGLTELASVSLTGNPATLAPLRTLPSLFNLEVDGEDIWDRQLPSERSGKLFAAIEKGDVRAARKALTDGASLFDVVDKQTPLRAAAKRQSLELFRLFVEQGAAVPAREQKLRWTGHAFLKKHAAALGKLNQEVLEARRAAEGFRLWTPRADTPDACTLEGVEGFRFFRFLEGKPCLSDFPKDAFCPMRGENAEQRKRTTLLDCHDANELVVISKRLKTFLEPRGGKGVEYLPVRIRDHRKKMVSGDYFVLNPMVQDCVDRTWSRPIGGTWHMGTRTVDFNTVTRLAIDEARAAPDRPLFRLNVTDVPLLIRKDLADALTNAGFTGLGFSHLLDLYDANGEARFNWR